MEKQKKKKKNLLVLHKFVYQVYFVIENRPNLAAHKNDVYRIRCKMQKRTEFACKIQ